MANLAARVPGRCAARRAAVALLFLVVGCAPSSRVAPAPAGEPVSRELALLTFDSAWSRIAHTHYDTAFNGVDWNAVRAELRPKAEAATTLNQLRGIISTMLARLGDSHYGLISREASSAVTDAGTGTTPTGEIAAELRLIDDDLLVWRVDSAGPAAAAGIRPGWRVIGIDGTKLAPRVSVVLTLPAQQQRTARTRLLYQVNALLKGAPGTAVTLQLEDARNRPVELRVTRRAQAGELVHFGNLPPVIAQLQHERMATPNGCVGIIRLNVWMAPLMPAFDRAVDALRDCAGVVIDLRGNPGGVAGMVMGTAGHFLNEALPLGFMRSRTSNLHFRANPRRVRTDGSTGDPYAGRLAIVTDEMSASTSEFFAAGLQGVGRARVFGGSSAGQALPALMIRLPTADVLMHVMADFTGPGGVRIEGRGVQPDVPVADTRESLLAGRDAPLRAAIDWTTGAPGAGTNPTGGT